MGKAEESVQSAVAVDALLGVDDATKHRVLVTCFLITVCPAHWVHMQL